MSSGRCRGSRCRWRGPRRPGTRLRFSTHPFEAGITPHPKSGETCPPPAHPSFEELRNLVPHRVRPSKKSLAGTPVSHGQGGVGGRGAGALRLGRYPPAIATIRGTLGARGAPGGHTSLASPGLSTMVTPGTLMQARAAGRGLPDPRSHLCQKSWIACHHMAKVCSMLDSRLFVGRSCSLQSVASQRNTFAKINKRIFPYVSNFSIHRSQGSQIARPPV